MDNATQAGLIIDAGADAPPTINVYYRLGEGKATLVEHQKLGQLRWNPGNIKFNLSLFERIVLRLMGKKVYQLNINIAKFICEHSDEIPVEWRGADNAPNMFPVWGTQYFDRMQHHDNEVLLPYLYFEFNAEHWSINYARPGSSYRQQNDPGRYDVMIGIERPEYIHFRHDSNPWAIAYVT